MNMAARTPTGKVRAGEQKNQFDIRTAVVSVTGSKVVDPGLRKRTKKEGFTTAPTYEIVGLHFEDQGGTGAERAQRPSAKKNSDGTFTIYCEILDPAAAGGAAWSAAVASVDVRWTILITG
jgi:hypothetical protein